MCVCCQPEFSIRVFNPRVASSAVGGSAPARPPPLPHAPPPGGGGAPPLMPFPGGKGPMTPEQLQKMLQVRGGVRGALQRRAQSASAFCLLVCRCGVVDVSELQRVLQCVSVLQRVLLSLRRRRCVSLCVCA